MALISLLGEFQKFIIYKLRKPNTCIVYCMVLNLNLNLKMDKLKKKDY